MSSFLVQALPDGPLDIIGDLHGELQALHRLLKNLGYQEDGTHTDQRTLVFVGDFCDRGPDSPGTIEYVKSLINKGKAFGILGNHEINLLIDDAKDGSGWFFDSRLESDLPFYAPFQRVQPEKKESIRQFLASLPLVLERKDLRVVHAAWNKEAIDAIRDVKTENMLDFFVECDEKANEFAKKSGILEKYLEAKQKWKEKIEDPAAIIPMLQEYADFDLVQNRFNPIRLLTSGTEAAAETPFFAGNRWRFSDRTPWWDHYDEPVPVVFGHYWRQLDPSQTRKLSRYSLLFNGIDPFHWHGKCHNAFCIDFSVGARWRERRQDQNPEATRFHLAALRWPEQILVTDTGFQQKIS